MLFSDYGMAMKTVFFGVCMMAVCALFYLIWWTMAFRPKKQAPLWASTTILVVTAICGILAVFWMSRGSGDLYPKRENVSMLYLLIGGAIVYLVLLLVTGIAFHRMVTTELLLIVGWALLNLIVLNALYGYKLFSISAALIFVVITIIIMIASLYCYLRYYQLDEQKRFIDGCIPLALIGIESVVMAITMWVCQK